MSQKNQIQIQGALFVLFWHKRNISESFLASSLSLKKCIAAILHEVKTYTYVNSETACLSMSVSFYVVIEQTQRKRYANFKEIEFSKLNLSCFPLKYALIVWCLPTNLSLFFIGNTKKKKSCIKKSSILNLTRPLI